MDATYKVDTTGRQPPGWDVNGRLPMSGIGHGKPGFLRRQRVALLQKLDGMFIRGPYEGHVAVAGRPIDGDAGLHEALTQAVDVIDLVSEMAKIASLAVV